MKSKLFLIPLLTLLFSCEIEGNLTHDAANVVINEGSTANKFRGVFSPTSGISGSGIVKIYLQENNLKLALENYTIESGPDLKVYLSKSNAPTDFVNLGNLNPATVYSIPKNIEIKNYKFVLIHCQQYNHLFALAKLIQN